MTKQAKKENQERILVDETTIKNKIYFVHGKRVMLDVDLAMIYGYETKRFNEQVKNNIERFDEDFRFQLTKEEYENLRSNFSTSSWGGIRHLPYAFTEEGIYMLMTVLKGDLAVRQSKFLIRFFKKMKDYIIERQEFVTERDSLQLFIQATNNSNKMIELQSNIMRLENKMTDMENSLSDMVTHSELSEYMKEFHLPSVKSGYLIFNGEPFQSDLIFAEIYTRAQKSIYVIDNYINIKTLHLLVYSQQDIEITIFSDNISKELTKSLYEDFKKEYPSINIKICQSCGKFHDRYIILDYGTDDETIFLCGASSKDGGRRISSILEDNDREKYHYMIDTILENPLLLLK